VDIPATLICDFYKISHRKQYPVGTEIVYSTLTPRSNKYCPNTDFVVAFGFQQVIKKFLIEYFNKNFFRKKHDEVIIEYVRIIKNCLGVAKPDTTHISELHSLGFLPIKIKAVKEGIRVPFRVPLLTIENTDSRFFWLTNYLETLISCELWQPMTAATIADKYKEILNSYAHKTVGNTDFVPFQGHDFSMRGMCGVDAAANSGSGHLLSFIGTDTIPAILNLEKYYNADTSAEIVGTSIPATEHSVMCAGGDGHEEYNTYKRLITDVYPNGFVSIVSDTWDLWNTITNILPRLKNDIMARDGRVVIRPDSGDPVDIICGVGGESAEGKGVIQLLWEMFGGITNSLGYKELDPHIGCIYGDAITIDRCTEICKRLEKKGFASTNMVYGVGSYTYQYNTRDTFGFAIKSTLCKINGVEKFIYKDPATDDGTKKSQTGAVAVIIDGAGNISYIDELNINSIIDGDILRTIFVNGELMVDDTLTDIRKRLAKK